MKNKKQNQGENSRRDFIKSSALAFAGISLIPRHVLGGPGFIAPSDKLRVASIGIGGMGYGDLSGVHKSGKVDIIALCDVDDTRAAKGRQDHSKATYYKDYRVLLEKEEKMGHGYLAKALGEVMTRQYALEYPPPPQPTTYSFSKKLETKREELRKVLREMLNFDTYLTAEETVVLGFADEVYSNS